MTFTINTHDSWGIVPVGEFATLAAARDAFTSLCNDPWYRADGTVKGLELVCHNDQGTTERLDWFGFG